MTARSHWGLTEQLFRSVLVVSSKPQRSSEVTIQGAEFHVAVRKPAALFGTSKVWRGRERVEVSDPSRTIVDVLDDPVTGGRSAGISKLDPSIRGSGRIAKRWGLRVNARIDATASR